MEGAGSCPCTAVPSPPSDTMPPQGPQFQHVVLQKEEEERGELSMTCHRGGSSVGQQQDPQSCGARKWCQDWASIEVQGVAADREGQQC